MHHNIKYVAIHFFHLALNIHLYKFEGQVIFIIQINNSLAQGFGVSFTITFELGELRPFQNRHCLREMIQIFCLHLFTCLPTSIGM